MTQIQQALGRSAPFVNVQPLPVASQRAPSSADTNYPLVQQWLDQSVSPPRLYTYLGGGTWETGGNALATTTVPGIVLINTSTTMAGASDDNVPTSLAIKTYADALVIAGAPVATTTTSGIGRLVSDANAVARLASTGAQAYFVQPSNLTAVMSAPGPIGDTTPSTGAFTTLGGTTETFTAGGSWATGGTAITIATDATTDAVTIATGGARTVKIADSAHAHIVTLGSATGAASLALKAGSGNFALTGAAGTTYTFCGSATTGTCLIGGTAQTGNITLGSSSGTNNVLIGNGAGTTTVNIANVAIDAICNIGAAMTTGTIVIGGTAMQGTMTLGSSSATNSQIIAGGTGATTLTLANVQTAGSVSIGAGMTSGTISIGGTGAQVGNFTLAPSTAAQTIAIGNGNGAKTINFGNGVSGNTIAIGNGINTSAQVINIASGASGANSDVNILAGNGSAGTQTCNILKSTRAGALNLATGAAAHVIAVGSASAGAITMDTAAGISLDAATASNFTVTGAADLTLRSTLGSIIINAEEAVADAIDINSAAGGVDVDCALQMNLDSSQSAVNAIRVFASNAAGGMDMDCGTGGWTFDTTGVFSIDGADSSNVTVTGASKDLTLSSVLGSVNVTASEAAANAIRIQASDAAGGIDIDCGTGIFAVDTTGVFSIDGADSSNVTVTGASKDLTLSSSGGSVNITATEAVANAIVLTASDAAGGIDITTGGGSVDISSAGFVTMVAGTATSGTASNTINTNVFAATYTGFTTASAGTQTFTIVNSKIATTSQMLVTCSNLGANDARMQIQRIKQLAGSVEVYTYNAGAAALNGNVVITGWVLS